MAVSPAATVQMAMLGRGGACACFATFTPHHRRDVPRRWGAGAIRTRRDELAAALSVRQRDRDVTGVLSEIEISPSEARL